MHTSVTAEVSEDNAPHETNSKALVDDKDQPPAQEDVYVAAAPTPEVPSAAEEEEVEVNMMEGVTELAGVAGVADTLDDVEVPIEDEVAAFGKRYGGGLFYQSAWWRLSLVVAMILTSVE